MARIFLSAVTGELRAAREIAARVLRTLGYEPVYQDEFPAGAGDLRKFLRDLIDPCDAVIQLIGFRYGLEPAEVDPSFGRISYTQYEAEYAQRAGKKVYFLLLESNCAAPDLLAEDPVLSGLQQAYRAKVESGNKLFHPAASLVELELKVHQLHNELRAFRERVERRQKRTLVLVGAGVVLAVMVAWWVWKVKGSQQDLAGEQKKQGQALAGVDQKLEAIEEKLLSALRQAPVLISLPGPADLPTDDATRRAAAYARLEKELALPAGTLERELPKLAGTLLKRPETSPLDRANALFIQKLYVDAEKEAEASVQKSIVAGGQAVQDIIAGRMLAGFSARAQAEKGEARVHWARAVEHFRAAATLTDRERDPVQWALVHHALTFDLGSLGRYDEAVPLLRSVLAERERTLGATHPDTLSSANNLAVMLERKGDYAGAEPIYRRVLASMESALGPEHPNTLRAMSNLGSLLFSIGDRAGAEALLRKALETSERALGAEHRETLVRANNLAVILQRKGDLTEAEKLLRTTVERRQRALGLEHPDTILSQNNLAALLRSKGDYAAAEALFRQALEVRERILGKDHPETLQTMGNLAELLDSKGDRTAAEPLYRRTLEGRERTLGKEHPATLNSVNNLASLLEAKGDAVGAEALYHRALEASERTLGATHPDTLVRVNNLASLLAHQGKLPAAEILYRRTLESRERTLGPDHPDTLLSVNNLAWLLAQKHDDPEAEKLYRRGWEACTRARGPEHPDTCLAAFNLAGFLIDHQRLDEAKPLLRGAYAGWLKTKGAGHDDTKEAARILEMLGEPVAK